MSSPKEPSPAMEYFKEALAYQISADRLLALIAPQPRIGLPLSDPIYFLYHHAAELALQACLLAHNLLQEGVRALIVDIEPHLRAWGHNKGVAGPWDRIRSPDLGTLSASRPIQSNPSLRSRDHNGNLDENCGVKSEPGPADDARQRCRRRCAVDRVMQGNAIR